VAVIIETDGVAGCRATYREIKATLPANLSLGFEARSICKSLSRADAKRIGGNVHEPKCS